MGVDQKYEISFDSWYYCMTSLCRVCMNFAGEANEQEGQVDQTTFACVEAAQTTEQQGQVSYEVVQLPQSQTKQPKEKKIFKCQTCEKIFSHTGKQGLKEYFSPWQQAFGPK